MDTDARTGVRERDASPTGAAAEAGLALERTASSHAPRRADLRDHLPALETERQVTDWGRSERVEGLFDRTVYEFFYNYWFRCEVEGIEHVPAEGGALIVSNHSGALPPDAPMIAQALKREHARPRPLHITVEHFFKGYPGFSMLVPKLGCVPAHPANVHRLLADEEQLVLVFPEGRKGTVKTYKDRYRLRRFGRGGFVEAAMRARAPIQPVALIGAEEAAPIFAHFNVLAKLSGFTYFPLTPTFPHFGVLGMFGYLPAKFKIRFLPPIPTDDLGEAPWEDAGLVQTMAQDVRDLIQDHVVDMVGKRRSVWFG
jgi:1-acyl-sn-glycerol-3-phosphate acyltransferase